MKAQDIEKVQCPNWYYWAVMNEVRNEIVRIILDKEESNNQKGGNQKI